MRPVRRSWVLRDSEMIDQRGRFTNCPGRKQWRLLKRTQRPRRTLCHIVRSIDNVRCNVVSRTGKSSDLSGVGEKKKEEQKKETTLVYTVLNPPFFFFFRIFLEKQRKSSCTKCSRVRKRGNRRVKRRREWSRFISFAKILTAHRFFNGSSMRYQQLIAIHHERGPLTTRQTNW